jgi:hypothetical protein
MTKAGLDEVMDAGQESVLVETLVGLLYMYDL